MRREVYADNAATTQIDFSTLNEMKPYLLSEYGNASQPYFFSKKCRNALNEARKTIATCINADEDEIFFTSSGTESDNWAIKGLMFASENKKTIVTSEIEHHAVLKACDSMQKKGLTTNQNDAKIVAKKEKSKEIIAFKRQIQVIMNN